MCRVLGLITRRTARTNFRASRCTLGVDRRAQRFRVRLIDQTRNRNFHEIRIAHVLRAIGERASHGLGHQVITIGRACFELLQVEAFEDVEHLDQHGATRRRRRHRDNLVTTIVTTHGRALLCDVTTQVFHRHQAVVAFHVGNDQAGRLAFVKLIWTNALETLESRGKLRLTEELALFVELPAF